LRRSFLLALLLLCGCAARRPELTTVPGEGLLHGVLVQPAGDRNELHVYIEGDGTPWLHGTEVAAAPAVQHPVALALMRRDPAYSVYVGRPCYFGASDGCTPELWTSARYSARVVDSMRAVVRRMIDSVGAKRVVFIGHSGGGTLAVLLAPSFDESVAVVTLAGNLDVRAWTQWHHYAPLDPVDLPPLPARIHQLHLVGGRDQNIPPQIATKAIERLGASPLVYARFDHACCWERCWPEVLRRLRALLD